MKAYTTPDKQDTVDEFEELEAELNGLKSASNLETFESVILAIEYEGVEPTMFLREEREYWNFAKRLGYIFLGILLTPFLGLGLFIIYNAFANGRFFDETDVAYCTIYLAERRLVVTYRMVDENVKDVKFLPVKNTSFVRYTQQDDLGDGMTGRWSGEFYLHTDGEKLHLVSVDNDYGERAKCMKVINQFAKEANIKFLR